jgi:hypothetical protein
MGPVSREIRIADRVPLGSGTARPAGSLGVLRGRSSQLERRSGRDRDERAVGQLRGDRFFRTLGTHRYTLSSQEAQPSGNALSSETGLRGIAQAIKASGYQCRQASALPGRMR